MTLLFIIFTSNKIGVNLMKEDPCFVSFEFPFPQWHRINIYQMVTSGIRAELIWNFLLHRAFVFDGRRNLYLILTDDSHAPGACVISELSDCYWMPFNFRNQKTFKNKGSLSSRVHSLPGAINGVLVTVQKMI